MSDTDQAGAGTAPEETKASERPIALRPLDWYRAKATPWKIACLAASMAHWDPYADDDCLVTEDVYDAAVLAAEQLLARCRVDAASLADSTAQRRVFILTMGDAMAAVVAYKPSVAESQSLLLQVRDPESDPAARQNLMCNALWTRVLWPKGEEAQRVMDEVPVGYGVTYPTAYVSAIGMSGADVRKKP